jgi:hypothetical protein
MGHARLGGGGGGGGETGSVAFRPLDSEDVLCDYIVMVTVDSRVPSKISVNILCKVSQGVEMPVATKKHVYKGPAPEQSLANRLNSWSPWSFFIP